MDVYLLIYFSACVCICIAARVLICSISESVCMYVRTYVLVLILTGIREARKNEAQALVVFPCVLKILPQYIFNKKDPIVIGS